MLTIEEWQARLAAYLAAEVAVLSNQEYEIETGNGRRRLKRADLGIIRAGISECNIAIARMTAGSGRRTFYLVPE